MPCTTHYSPAMRPSDLSRGVVELAGQLVDLGVSTDTYPVLVYSGMSGVAIATALSIELYKSHPEFKFYMAYVRKDTEISHGRSIEYSYDVRYGGPGTYSSEARGVFVDDLIDSGKTLRYVSQRVKGKLGLLVNTTCLYDDRIVTELDDATLQYYNTKNPA